MSIKTQQGPIAAFSIEITSGNPMDKKSRRIKTLIFNMNLSQKQNLCIRRFLGRPESGRIYTYRFADVYREKLGFNLERDDELSRPLVTND